MPAQIVRRRNDRGTRVLADANRNHVAPHAMSGPDSGVEAIANDVSQGAVGDDLEADRGIGGEKFREDRLDHRFRGRAWNGETKVAAGLVAKNVDGLQWGLETVERRQRVRKTVLPR